MIDSSERLDLLCLPLPEITSPEPADIKPRAAYRRLGEFRSDVHSDRRFNPHGSILI